MVYTLNKRKIPFSIPEGDTSPLGFVLGRASDVKICQIKNAKLPAVKLLSGDPLRIRESLKGAFPTFYTLGNWESIISTHVSHSAHVIFQTHPPVCQSNLQNFHRSLCTHQCCSPPPASTWRLRRDICLSLISFICNKFAGTSEHKAVYVGSD